MSASYVNILEDVVNDRLSGAWQVSKKAIHCLDLLAQEKATAGFAEFVSEIERVISAVLKAQTGMAQLVNFFNVVLLAIENEKSNDAIVLARKISGEARRFLEFSDHAVAKVAGCGSELIHEDSQVLLHSNSSTIMEILKSAKAAGKTFEVILTESRPINEGQTCARELSQMEIQSTYFVDAGIAKGVDRADLVLLGADTVSENSLINKIGSRAICLLARETVVPCYAACESSKFISSKLAPKREQLRDPAEVWADPPSETTVENYYFEEVALELFTGIITESGVLTPEETRGKIGAKQMSKRLIEMLK